jgi:outer membrane PBP1 activator LpoA protein
MTRERLTAVARSWGGLAAAAIALCSAVWLAAEYAHAVRVESGEKAQVEALKAQARTDPTIHQKLLQPEFDRQRESLERRHAVYNRVGLLLVVSLGVWVAWFRWLRPKPGEWVGVPARLQRWMEGNVDHPPGRLIPLKIQRPQR